MKRQIWPSKVNTPELLRSKSAVITEEDWKSILEKLTKLAEYDKEQDESFSKYKEELAAGLTTIILNSTRLTAEKADLKQAVIEVLETNDITTEDLTAAEITSTLADITRAVISSLVTDTLSATSADIKGITAEGITAENGLFDSVTTTNLTVDKSQWNEVDITDASIASAEITEASIQKAEIEEAAIEEADVNTAVVQTLDAIKSDIREANYHYLTHKEEYNKQVLSDYSVVSDFYLVFPKLVNGKYNAVAIDSNLNKAFSIELNNSIQNNWFAWSSSDKYLLDVEFFTDEEGIERIQFHGKTLGQQLTLYSSSDSYDTTDPIDIYSFKKYDTGKDFDITEANGIYLPNAVFAGKFHADEMLIDDVVFEVVTVNKAIKLPTEYDQYGVPVNYSTGHSGDYITVTEPDEFGTVGLKWQTPTHNTEPTAAVERNRLITEATLGNYTGELESEGIEHTVAFDDFVVTGKEYYYLQGKYLEITDKLTVTTPAQYEKIDYEELNATVLDKYIGATDNQITSYSLEDQTVTTSVATYDWADVSDRIYQKLSEESTAYYIELEDSTRIEITDGTVTYYTDVGDSEYNLIHLGNGTVTHGSHEIAEGLTVDGNTLLKSDVTVPVTRTDEEGNVINNSVKLPNFYNGPEATLTDGLNIQNNLKDDDDNPLPVRITRNRNFTEDGEVVLKKDPIAVMNEDGDWDEDHDKKPVVYNYERDALQPADDLTLDSLEVDYLKVNNDADVGGDVRIAGDLYVSGTSHIVDEETVSTTGDTLVLRQNATTGLNEGQVSGLVINNYEVDSEGNAKDLSLVTDRDGTLRVGTGTGTVTSYSKIAWNESERKWYSYDDTDPDDIQYTILATQPTGTVTDYQGKTEKAPYTLYSSVTFTVIDKTTLQPLLTRDEEEDIDNQAILKYDKDNHKATALPLPTVNGQQLTGNITTDEEGNTTYSYSWSGTSKPAIFRFATREEYEEALEITEGNTGYIPDGSLVVIDEEVNNVMEEETE